MKTITVIAGESLIDLAIQPGTRPQDIVEQLRLPSDSWISGRDGRPFDENEDIYSLVANGTKLFSSAPAEVAVWE